MTAEDTFTWLPITMRTAREKRGWSQKELAKESGVGDKTISTYETGLRIHTIKLWQLFNIAEALGTTVAELLIAPAAEIAVVRTESRTLPAPEFKRPRPVMLLPFSDFHRSSLGEAWR